MLVALDMFGPLANTASAISELAGDTRVSLARLVGRARDDGWRCLDAGDPGRGAAGGQGCG